MSAAVPLILLPPSEGKAIGGTGPVWTAGAGSWSQLDSRRLSVAKALRAAMRKPVASRAKLLGVKGEALAVATATNLGVLDGPTMPAIERYTGVLYDELAASTLPAAVRRRLEGQVVIFSGLLGVVRPTDPIPDYKLKMGAAVGRPGKLSTWWRGPVSDALAPEATGRVVWDLLPNEHRAAWSPAPVGSTDGPVQIVSTRFLDEVAPERAGGTPSLVAVAHWNKLLKGSLVRHILTTQLTDVDGLVDFDHPRGYRYRPDLTENEGTLTRVAFVRPIEGHGDGPEKPNT
jgi:cytoplasmic iron level regulating protein YaaA (DUF328/UPF0246 family)